MLHASIESNEDLLGEGRGESVHESRVAVLLLNNDLDAAQGGGEAHRRGDVAAGADNEGGPES